MLYCLIIRFPGMSECAALLIIPHLFSVWKHVVISGPFFPCIRTEYGPEITFRAVIARVCYKIIWWKREQVAMNWESRNSSLHKLHQSFRKCLRRVTHCQGETLYYRINHRFNPCLFCSYCSHCLFNMLHKLYSDV